MYDRYCVNEAVITIVLTYCRYEVCVIDCTCVCMDGVVEEGDRHVHIVEIHHSGGKLVLGFRPD